MPYLRQLGSKSGSIIPQQSTKLQSNAHLGSGLLGGSVAGIEQSLNIKPLAEFGKNDKKIRLNLFCRWYPTYKSRVGKLL